MYRRPWDERSLGAVFADRTMRDRVRVAFKEADEYAHHHTIRKALESLFEDTDRARMIARHNQET